MIEVKELTELDQAEVDQNQAYIAQRLTEYAPKLYFRAGVLHDVVQHLHAVLETGLQDAVSRLVRSRSLLEIEDDPTLAEIDTVNSVLSNFNVSRLDGEAATGAVAVVLEGPFLVTIPQGAVFLGKGTRFRTNLAYASRINEGNVLSAADRLLRPIGDGSGRYYFTIEVTSESSNSAARLRQRDSLTATFDLQRFHSAYAADDFSGGFDIESNAELIARLREGIAAKTPSNRLTTAALIRQTEQFERVLGVSEVGYGDAEQMRYHSVFPIAFGGRRDIYARTAQLPQTITERFKAVLVSLEGEGGIWQVSIPKATAPGLYEVKTIVDAASTSTVTYGIVETLRGYDASNEAAPVDLAAADEAAFSPLQTIIVRFRDEKTVQAIGAQREVDVTVLVMPQLRDLQNFLADRGRRPGESDLLVRAPVPALLSAGFIIHKTAGQADPNKTIIQNEIAELVNNTLFPGRVSSAQLAAVVQQHLVDGQVCGAIEIFCRILRPDGTEKHIRSAEQIIVPSEPTRRVSARTVCFFLDPLNISIQVETI